MSNKCPVCKKYMIFPDTHRCLPAFECRRSYDDGHDGEWEKVHALDSEGAVIDYCEEGFSDWEYPSSGFKIDVKTAFTDGPIEVFEVEVESRPHFYASEVRTCSDEEHAEEGAGD